MIPFETNEILRLFLTDTRAADLSKIAIPRHKVLHMCRYFVRDRQIYGIYPHRHGFVNTTPTFKRR
jgi:hypothetical protein